MRKFRSHKLVEAGEIMSFDSAQFIVHVDSGEQVTVPSSFFARGEPAPGDYLVRYADGYLSWSPKKAFEEGYTDEALVGYERLGRAQAAAAHLDNQPEPKSGE